MDERKLSWTRLASAKAVQTRISADPQLAAQQEDLTATAQSFVDVCPVIHSVHLFICIDMFAILFSAGTTKRVRNLAPRICADRLTKSHLDRDTLQSGSMWLQSVVAVDWEKIKSPGIETKIRSCSGSSCSLRQTDIFKPCALTHTVLLLLCGSLVYLLPLSAPGRE